MARKPLSPPALELHDSNPISTNTTKTTNRLSFVASAKEESSTEELFDDFAPLDRKPSFMSERSSSTSTTTTTVTKTTTSGTTSQGASHSLESNDRIRSRYLFKLGVIGAQQGGSAIVSCSSSVSSSSSTAAKGQGNSECPTQVHRLVGNTNSSSTGGKRVVQFMTKVLIHAIPHHSNYSFHTKQLLWTSTEEMEEMTYRNYFEFASEQWDWRQAIEEDDFCLFAGKWTHPAHVTRFSPSRQFCLIRSARLQQEQLQQQHIVANGKRLPYRLQAWH